MEGLISEILARVTTCSSEIVASRVQRQRRLLLKRGYLGEHWLSSECVMLCCLRSVADVSFHTSVPVYNQLRLDCECFGKTSVLGEMTVTAAETAWRTHWYPAYVRLQSEREAIPAGRSVPSKFHIFADWYVVFIPERTVDKHFARLSFEKQLAIVQRRGGMGIVVSNLARPIGVDRRLLQGRKLAVVCATLGLAEKLLSRESRSRSGMFSVYRTDWIPACDLKNKVLSARAYAHQEVVTPDEPQCIFEAERVSSGPISERAPTIFGNVGGEAPSAPAVSRTVSTATRAPLMSLSLKEGGSPPPKRPRVDRSSFFCQRMEVSEEGLLDLFPNNMLICEVLSQLATHWELYGRKNPAAQFKVRGYRGAMNFVNMLSYDLTTVEDVRDLVAKKNVRVIGAGIGARMEEIVTTGSLSEAKGLQNSPTFAAMRDLTCVWGGKS